MGLICKKKKIKCLECYTKLHLKSAVNFHMQENVLKSTLNFNLVFLIVHTYFWFMLGTYNFFERVTISGTAMQGKTIFFIVLVVAL